MQGYQVGNRFYPYLIDAGDYAVRTNQQVVYKFYDEVFDKIDWKQKINLDLPTLYAIRARQIRDAYDYVIVAYSGGADSQNVLDSFIDNDIHVDEIVIWHDKDLTKTEDNWTNREALGVALKRAKRIVSENPKIRLRLVGSLDTIKAFHANKDFDEKGHITQPYGSILCAQRRGYWKNLIADYKKLVDINKKVGVIWGYDKPLVQYDRTQNKFYSWFENRVQGFVHSSLDLPIDNVFFYWTPDLPFLTIKMSQTIVENFQNLPLDFKDPYFKYYNKHSGGLKFFSNFFTKSGGKISSTLVNSWMYSKWDPTTFTEGKVWGNYFHSKEYDYWITDRKNEEVVIAWAKDIKYYIDKTRNFADRIQSDFRTSKLFGMDVGYASTKRYYLT